MAVPLTELGSSTKRLLLEKRLLPRHPSSAPGQRTASIGSDSNTCHLDCCSQSRQAACCGEPMQYKLCVHIGTAMPSNFIETQTKQVSYTVVYPVTALSSATHKSIYRYRGNRRASLCKTYLPTKRVHNITPAEYGRWRARRWRVYACQTPVADAGRSQHAPQQPTGARVCAVATVVSPGRRASFSKHDARTAAVAGRTNPGCGRQDEPTPYRRAHITSPNLGTVACLASGH